MKPEIRPVKSGICVALMKYLNSCRYLGAIMQPPASSLNTDWRDLLPDRSFRKDGDLLADVSPHNLPDVPEMRGHTGGVRALFLRPEFHRGCLGSAISAHHIPAPAVLFFQQSRTATEWTVLQFQFSM